MKLKTIALIALSFMIVGSSFANKKRKNKKITVSGYVTDVNENPLEGIAIIVDDVQSRVFTNKKGFYKIKIKPDTKTIMAYSVHLGGIEMDYVGHKKVNFVIKNDMTNAKYISPENGEILNNGFGLVSDEKNTFNMKKVEEDKLHDSYPDIYQMLSKVPGVIVSNGFITIRGISSIKAQGYPLFVVDGVETNTLAFINPRDIKNITVLKGAATAMYGSRGMFGVIVVTRKKGEK